MTSPTIDQWRELFASCREAACHLEMRDCYGVPDEDEDFRRWAAGERDDPDRPETWWRPWLTLMREVTDAGKAVRRARIVSEPVTDYTRWLWETTYQNIVAGEDVRWLPRMQASKIALPGNDFWLFDDRLVLFNHFTGSGDWAGQESTTEPAVVELCRSAFAAVWAAAIPHAEYEPACGAAH